VKNEQRAKVERFQMCQAQQALLIHSKHHDLKGAPLAMAHRPNEVKALRLFGNERVTDVEK
jgi:hypothetical protein